MGAPTAAVHLGGQHVDSWNQGPDVITVTFVKEGREPLLATLQELSRHDVEKWFLSVLPLIRLQRRQQHRAVAERREQSVVAEAYRTGGRHRAAWKLERLA